MYQRTITIFTLVSLGGFSIVLSYDFDNNNSGSTDQLPMSPFASAAKGQGSSSGTGGSPFSTSVSAGNSGSGQYSDGSQFASMTSSSSSGSGSFNGSPFASASGGSGSSSGNTLPNPFGGDSNGGSFSGGSSYGGNGGSSSGGSSGGMTSGSNNMGSNSVSSGNGMGSGPFNSASSNGGSMGGNPFNIGGNVGSGSGMGSGMSNMGSNSGGSGNSMGSGPFNSASSNGGGMGANPFNTGGNVGSGNGMGSGMSNMGSNSGGSGNGIGSGPFNSASSNGGGMGANPFNMGNNVGSGNGMGSGMTNIGSNSGNSGNGMGSGPFNTASSNGGSMGANPFNMGNNGGSSNGIGAGPFNIGGKGGESPSGAGMKSPFSVDTGKDKQNPFDMSKYTGSNLFGMASQGNGNSGDSSKGKDLFQMALQASGNSGSSSDKSPFAMTGSGSGGISGTSGKGPFNMDGLTSGPGGLGGGMFSIDTDGSAGPGGLVGGSFNTDMAGGPGGLAGGAFESGSTSYGSSGNGGMDNLNSGSNSVLQVDNSIYDTTKYQQMLQEQFSLDSYNSELSKNPFDGTGSGTYSGGTAETTGTGNSKYIINYDKNQYYSVGSYASTDNQAAQITSSETCHTCSDHFNSYTAGQQETQGPFEASALSNVGGLYSGKQSTGSGPFSTKGFGKANTPFQMHSSKPSALSASSDIGSYSGASGNTYSTGYTADNVYQDNSYSYNEMMSSPFKSDNGNGNYNQQYSVQDSNYVKTPFSDSDSSVGFGGRNPGGDPSNQGGLSMGMNGASVGHSVGMNGSSMRGRRYLLPLIKLLQKH